MLALGLLVWLSIDFVLMTRELKLSLPQCCTCIPIVLCSSATLNMVRSAKYTCVIFACHPPPSRVGSVGHLI